MRGIALGCTCMVRDAIFSLETASTLVPLSILGQIALAACYVRTHNLISAECIYEFLATRDDVPIHLLADVAKGLDQVDRPDLALDVCRVASERAPDCDSALFAMAHYMTQLGRPAESILAVVRQAFELRPDQPLYRIDLALLLANSGRLKEAYHLLTEVELDGLLQLHCPPRLLGMLAGLVIDEDNESDLTEARVKRWVADIRGEFGK